MTNRPIVFIDPSGNTYMCGAGCEAEYEKKQYSLDDQAALYGITFGEGWSVTSKAKTLVGVMKLAKSMQEAYNSYQNGVYRSCVNDMSSPKSSCSAKSATDVEVFTAVFGNLNFNVDGKSAAWMCGARSDGFSCSSDGNGRDINPRLAVHELGHTFNSQYNALGISPYSVLSSASIKTSQGTWVAGFHSVNGEWKWDRNPDFAGYSSNGAPGVYHGSATWSDWNATGIGVGEEFADMFMNWAFNSFTADAAGQARNSWMSSNMGYWLNNMVP